MAQLQDKMAMEGQSDAFDARSSLSDTTESDTLVSEHSTPFNVKHITKANKANILDRLAKARVSIEELIKIPYFRPSKTIFFCCFHLLNGDGRLYCTYKRGSQATPCTQEWPNLPRRSWEAIPDVSIIISITVQGLIIM